MLKEIDEVSCKFTVQQLAEYFGIGKTTFYAVCKRQPELMERYKKAKAKRIGNAVSSLYEKIENGDTTAIIFYLKTQAGWREQEAPKAELPPINIILTDEANDTTEQDFH